MRRSMATSNLYGVCQAKDPLVSDNYYLLNVMRSSRRGEDKEWGKLADEMMEDKMRDSEVKNQLLERWGLDGAPPCFVGNSGASDPR